MCRFLHPTDILARAQGSLPRLLLPPPPFSLSLSRYPPSPLASLCGCRPLLKIIYFCVFCFLLIFFYTSYSYFLIILLIDTSFRSSPLSLRRLLLFPVGKTRDLRRSRRYKSIDTSTPSPSPPPPLSVFWKIAAISLSRLSTPRPYPRREKKVSRDVFPDTYIYIYISIFHQYIYIYFRPLPPILSSFPLPTPPVLLSMYV